MSVSLNPQNVMGGKAWYYENPGSIDIVIPNDPALSTSGDRDIRVVRISRRSLEKSLRRMQSTRRARKSGK